jgi:[ribosomal protein S5]-alanine N-acetyltransferase
MSTIILTSERMLFRAHEPRDLEPYCAMEMDSKVRRYVGGYPRTREAAEQRFHQALANTTDTRLRMWATVLKAEDQYIGRCGLYPHMEGNATVPAEAALGFSFARAY